MASFGFGYDDEGGGGFSGSDLASTLIGAASSAFNTYEIANSSPVNAAILTGQGVSTPTLQTTGVPTMASARISGLGILALGAIAVVLFFALRR